MEVKVSTVDFRFSQAPTQVDLKYRISGGHEGAGGSAAAPTSSAKGDVVNMDQSEGVHFEEKDFVQVLFYIKPVSYVLNCA
jgi:hypothetical protein